MIKELNELLSDYQIFRMNTQGFHWNVMGDLFFEMHQKYKELYEFSEDAIDEIAERIRGKGAFPLHSFHEYLNVSKLKTHVFKRDPYEINAIIIDQLKVLTEKQSELMSMCLDSKDMVTLDIIQDLSETTEKWIWMFSAFLKKETASD